MHYLSRRVLRTAMAGVLLASIASPPAALAARPEQAGYKTSATSAAPGVSAAGAPEIPLSASDVASVAARHGLSASGLKNRLSKDKHLKIGRGRLMYQDATPAELGAKGAESSPAPAAQAAGTPSTAEAFALHSKLGSKRVIYLDFDGHLLSGTAWNDSYAAGADINAPAWDTSGNPAVFSETERAAIVEIWQRVAEDYSGFDVDVTTQYPGEAAISRSSSADEYYGMRVLISPISDYVGPYGGVAYIGVFDETAADYYKPALVFPEQLANNAKFIAEAASHECGHTLGLYHDGTTAGVAYYAGHGSGSTSWAPIMGNSYTRTITQWSKGEYPLADNTEDDLLVIQANGLAYRADDMGGTMASARDVGSTGSFVVDGRIERNNDIDMMRFTTGAGTLFVNAAVAWPGPNMDLIAELWNSSGGLVAMSNPLDTLGASISVSVSAGTYFLSVRGTGLGDLATGYSSYGCIGQYTVTATGSTPVEQVPPVASATGTPLSGSAPLNVQFSSSFSSDPDGQIVGWSWDFDDGGTSSAANPAHTFTGAGTYVVRLTVTDDAGLTATTTVNVSVLTPNAAPVAAMTAAPTSGRAPLAVQFSGAGSIDSDGSIVSYSWSFGDGATASGPNVTHTFSAGARTVRLTVTDNRGATNTASTVVMAQSSATNVIRVASLKLVTVSTQAGNQARATVRVTTPEGVPISGVIVTGSWSGLASGTAVGTTDGSGYALLSSRPFKTAGTLKFTVVSLSKVGYSYNPSWNVVGSSTIAAAASR